MKFENETISQHFLSQVEQRMNSFNLGAEKRNRKIYSFKVTDRDGYIVQLENPKGVKISSNLYFDDLFTFYKGAENIRKNLEGAFGEYESKILSLTNTLMEKINDNENGSDVSDLLVELLRVKFLNFLRNPFSIKKILNSVGDLPNHYPVQKNIFEEFRLIEGSYKPHVDRLCNLFNVTYEEYIKWIKMLFLVLMRPDGTSENMLEGLVRNLLENKDFKMMFIVFHYTGEHEDKKVCLSDRTWVDCIEDNADQMGMDFNLTSNAFLRFGAASIKKLTPPGTPQYVVDAAMARMKNIDCIVIENDLDALKSYNQNAVLQSYERVFCSSPNIYGL